METKRRERGRKGEEVAQLQLLRICCKSRPGRHVASCALNADDDDDALLLPLLLAACPIQAAKQSVRERERSMAERESHLK